MTPLRAFSFILLVFVAGALFGAGHWILGVAACCGALFIVHDTPYMVSNHPDNGGAK